MPGNEPENFQREGTAKGPEVKSGFVALLWEWEALVHAYNNVIWREKTEGRG